MMQSTARIKDKSYISMGQLSDFTKGKDQQKSNLEEETKDGRTIIRKKRGITVPIQESSTLPIYEHSKLDVATSTLEASCNQITVQYQQDDNEKSGYHSSDASPSAKITKPNY